MRVAYILSMAKSGLAAWNHREIDILTRRGVDIWAYPLKWLNGPCMPRPDWHFRRPDRLRTLLVQPLEFLADPARYLRLLRLAIRMRTVLEFLLASDYSLEMKSVGVTHIHCHFGDRKLFVGYFCSRFLDLPLSVTVHAYEILANPNPAMFKLAAAACRTVVAISEFNKREIVRLYGLDERKVKVIHLDGDVSDDRRSRSTKILMVASFTEKKGHEVLFEAIRKLGRNDITVWIAGTGKRDVPALAEQAGVSRSVLFLGALKGDLLNILYDACDMVVLPSHATSFGDREGIPVALMEAMSHRKPIVSTTHAGIPELVPEILVPENDPDALAKAIAYLADNPNIRAKQGERNYEIIKRNFSEAAVLELLEEFALRKS